MVSAAEWVTFTTLSLAIAASPGPATAYIIASGLADGPKSALRAVAGLVSASLILGAIGIWATWAIPAEAAHGLDVIRAVAPWVILVMAARMVMPAKAGGPAAAAAGGPSRRPNGFFGGALINFVNPGQYAVFFFIVPKFQEAQPSALDATHFALPLLFTAIAALTYLGVLLIFKHFIHARVTHANMRQYPRLGSALVLTSVALYLFVSAPALPGDTGELLAFFGR